MNTDPVRHLPQKSELGISELELVRAVFSSPDLYEIAKDPIEHDPSRGGRPQIYPEYLVLGFGCLAQIYRSARAAATALHGPIVWQYVCDLVREQFPHDPSMWLPESPPSRTWFIKRKNRIKEHGLERLRDDFTSTGVAAARDLGLLAEDGPGTKTHPDASRMIHHDGKAIRQMFNRGAGETRDVRTVDAETGEVTVEQLPVRSDPDAKVHVTGDDRQIHGCKFWHAEVRDTRTHSRVFLAVDYVPEVKGAANSEADIAVKNLLALSPLVPGALGTMADTVLRGTHIDTLERATGWIVMNPVAAKRVNNKTLERTEKEQYLRTEAFECADGRTINVEIWTKGGRLARVAYADDGERVLVPLRRVGNPVRRNPGGDFRTYVEYEVPHPQSDTKRRIMEPTFNRADDTFNRAENVRQIPPGDPDYVRLMGRRSDAEAANRVVDDHLYLRRAISIGAKGQLFDLICHALMQNSLARYRHGSPGPPGAELAA